MRNIRVGRNVDNDIVLNVPVISAHHATITIDDYGNIALRDHSSNGTMVNGYRIHNQSVNLRYGDSVVFPGQIPLNWNLITNVTPGGTQRIDYNDTHQNGFYGAPQGGYQGAPQGGYQGAPQAGYQGVPQGGYYGAPQGGNQRVPQGGYHGVQYGGYQGESQSEDQVAPQGENKGANRRERRSMSFGEAISSVFGHYFNFTGRARRAEYWYFALFNILVNICLLFLIPLDPSGSMWLVFAGLYNIVVFFPSWSVLARRLHDTGRSGWCVLLIMIPFIGFLIILVWIFSKGDDGTNEYGPDPRYY